MINKMATADLSVTKREKRHLQISTQIAAQGIVLLENRGCLPLDDTIETIALFGGGGRRTLKGGTGSGDVHVRKFVSVEQGLLNAGYKVVTIPWLDELDTVINHAKALYEEKIREASKEGAFAGLMAMMSNPFQEPDFRQLSMQELMKYRADVAVYVLARNSGEGADRKPEKGDYDLSSQEIHDITLLSKTYDKFILLLNTGGVVDLSKVYELTGIGAIVLMGQGGSGTGDAVAAVLSGKVTPSGKLTATWARSYTDYPFSDEYGSLDGDIFDSYYKEGIYVGYRYFDSFSVSPQYPFGFGRSYTDFSIDLQSVSIEENTLRILAKVTNTGKRYQGREVIQVYASLPQGKLDKPYQMLVCFKKTKILLPGESQSLTLSFSLERMASYDESTAVWILEQGDYFLRCGNSSRDTFVAAVVTIPQTIITESCRNLFRGEKVEAIVPDLSDSSQDYQNAKHFSADVRYLAKIEHTYLAQAPELTTPKKVSLDDVKGGRASLEELAACMIPEELAMLCVGAARLNLKDFSIIGNFSNQLPGAAGETTSQLKKYGIPNAILVDGPAGIRITPKIYKKGGKYIQNPAEDPILGIILPPEQAQVDLRDAIPNYQYCTALPIATMLAQTWDMELLEQAGHLIGAEMEELGVDLWLAPSLNIQRNPLCGRNFEYFSEDPLLSGLCAAAITRGVQHFPGKGTTIKHFAANNQETNRNYNNSHVSERTLREIYLKGFEICIKESHPLAVMTSYNLINGLHSANDRDLLTAVLRDEWGFDGLVMTDWGTTSNLFETSGQKYGSSEAPLCIYAGNDLIMPGSQRDIDRILAALADGSLSLGVLQHCAINILRFILRINR